MSHSVAEEPILNMGPAVPKGKLAMWIFLSTEIMFFTALIGVYLIYRNGQPTPQDPWPKPHDVHLEEIWGAVNTFVLILSSVTIVLAHYALTKKAVSKAVLYVAVTLLLGFVFLGIKAYEYSGKFRHGILPGRVYDRLDGRRGAEYLTVVREDLKHLVEGSEGHPAYTGAGADKIKQLYDDVKLNSRSFSKITPREAGKRVNEILEANHDLHLPKVIPWGNLWSSCYFAMTGFHALHVFGGLVIFVVILCLAGLGRFGTQHESLLELTGLYWHFVDIVWIFLFPLLYLV